MRPRVAEVHADPQLVSAWLAARSVGRGLAQPLPDSGGLRVETGLPQEVRRYVFAAPCAGLRELGEAITAPRIMLKLCGTGQQLLAQLPPRWRLAPGCYLMTCDRVDMRPELLPEGYTMRLMTTGPTTVAQVGAPDGSLAAEGYAVEHGSVFIYDRIGTHEAHRRRGLGRAVMRSLSTARLLVGAPQILVATEQGRALYATLGWQVHSPYATATIAAAEHVPPY